MMGHQQFDDAMVMSFIGSGLNTFWQQRTSRGNAIMLEAIYKNRSDTEIIH